MDLNYLFKRQQVETSLARSGANEAARLIHRRLASLYEERIELATRGVVRFRHQLKQPTELVDSSGK